MRKTKTLLPAKRRAEIEARAVESNQLSSAVSYAQDTALLFAEVDRLVGLLCEVQGEEEEVWRICARLACSHCASAHKGVRNISRAQKDSDGEWVHWSGKGRRRLAVECAAGKIQTRIRRNFE